MNIFTTKAHRKSHASETQGMAMSLVQSDIFG